MYYLANFKQNQEEKNLGYWQTVGRDTKRGAILGAVVPALGASIYNKVKKED